ncbi:MAG: class I SAM-dependent methyltransferase [Cohaesibacter sp.]|nr:class I SAM-dependent methyltransferase [Cohaesibacter sp.]
MAKLFDYLTGRSSASRHQKQYDAMVHLIESEFDDAYYQTQDNIPALDKKGLIRHYLDQGAHEGKNPAPWFSTKGYLKTYPDIAASGVNPFYHYLKWGKQEGREANNIEASQSLSLMMHHMDLDYYRDLADLPNHNPKELVEHFDQVGVEKGLSPTPWFSPAFYLDKNADVRDLSINPFFHYLKWGKQEGRATNRRQFDGYVSDEAQQALIAPHFIPAFYLHQIGRPLEDPLTHFCHIGWKKGLDPNPDFSTRYYLDHNPDIRALELNPYFHYLQTGYLEGRPSKASTQAFPALSHDETETKASKAPHTALIAQIHNQADILSAFANHALALFDTIILVDHASMDQSADLIETLSKSHSTIQHYKVTDPSIPYDDVLNYIVQDCEILQSADWLFTLNADDFLPFASKKDFVRFLSDLSDHPLISLKQKTIIPHTYWDYAVTDWQNTSFYIPKTGQDKLYHAVQLKKLSLENRWMNAKGGTISTAKGMDPLTAYQSNAVIFHLPVRSAMQLSLALDSALIETLNKNSKGQDTDWAMTLEHCSNLKAMHTDLLNGIAYGLGQNHEKAGPITQEELVTAGYHCRPLPSAFLPSLSLFDNALPSPVAPHAIRAQREPAKDKSEGGAAPVALIKNTDNCLLRDAQAKAAIYESLPERSKSERSYLLETIPSPLELLKQLQKDSYLEIRNLTPSAWAGHLPFMLTLSGLIKPRRYVELGTHHGASFFAYCQASARAFLKTQAIAIDCWEGDIHAGHYDNHVFDDFKQIIGQYEGFARYIRGYFDDAVHQFADGSIDLLHIDGLHTYHAVKNDFETWLPKMSAEGLILFHDINVHERDFGVWQLWEELKSRYPSAQFLHSHGLGILYVGTEKESGIKAMVDMMSDPALSSLLQTHFESVAQLSVGLANAKIEISDLVHQHQLQDMTHKALGEARERNILLEQENNQLRQQIASLHTQET